MRIRSLSAKILKKLSAKIILSLLAIIVIGVPLLYLTVLNQREAKASWFSEDWLYRKAIPISAHTTAETNVYISTTLDTSDTTKFQGDCGDLRFTKENGELLPYYISSGCSTATTVIHVNFDSFPAGAQTIYYYYGNPGAPNGFNSADFATEASNYTIGSLGSEVQGPGPVGYWKFDDAQDTNAQDSSSANNDGTLGGTTIPTWQSENVCVSGKCLFFDGATSKVTGSKIAYGIQSVSFWVRPNTIATQGILDLDGGTHKITTDGSGVLSATGFTSPTYYINGVATATPTLVLNKWNHVVITTTAGFNSTATFTIGTDGTYFIKGFLDDVKFYPYARTQAQIRTDFNNGSSRIGSSVQIGPQNQWLSQGLIGYWKMDETATPSIDSSGNGYSGTWNGTAAAAAGKFGNSISLDGNSDYVSTSSISVTAPYSYSFWVNTSTLAADQGLFGEGSTNVRYWRIDTSGNLVFRVTGGEHYMYTSNITAGTWQHMVITYDASNNVAVYRNGILAGSGNQAGLTQALSSIGFARDIYLNGKLDEVRTYNRAFSPKEVSDLYNWAPGPVGYWDFEEGGNVGVGSTAYDKSGNNNAGVWAGTGNHTNSGKYGKAGNFNGVDDYIDTTNSSVFSPSAVTVETWINPTVIGIDQLIISKDLDSNPNYGWQIYLGSDNKIHWAANGTGDVIGTTILSANTWYHVVGIGDTTGNSNATIIYVNGVQDKTGTQILNTQNQTLVIGAKGNATRGGKFNGKIDDVKIYNYARSQKQIIADMTGGAGSAQIRSVSVQSPLGYWKFDEGQGTTANNSGSGGTGLNGTISNGTWSLSGKFGKALTFASNTSVTTTITDPGYSNTISLWLNPSTSVASKTLVTASKLTTDSSSRPVYSGCTGTALSLSAWTHIVAVSDGSGSCKIYQNGVQTASSTTGVTFGTSVNIGASSYTGLIDEFKLYSYPLTADEVKTEYNHGQSMQLGAAGTNSSYAPGAANQEYCVPGDATSCAAPVGRWDFEEGTGTAANDTSGNANTGTLAGGPTWTSGKVGKGVNFDGTNDIVNVANESNFDYTSSFTIEAWINPTGSDTYNGIVGKYVGTATGWDFILTNGKSRMAVRGSSSIDNSGVGSDLRDGKWHHVVAVVNGTSSITTYTDGKFIDTTTGTWTAVTNDGTVAIGGRYNAPDLPFRGKIDQVRIFNYARSAAQVAYDYNRGAPVGWWKFDECQGAIAHDSSGNSNTGTITIGATGTQTSAGTCTAVNTATAWYNGVTGKRNASLNFDGIDDAVNAGQVLPTAVTTPFTFSAWVNPATGGAGTWRTIIGTHTSYAEIAISSSNQFTCGQNAGGGFFQPSTFTITNGTWYHFVCTYDGTNLSTYINGVLKTGPTARTFTNASHGVTLIGKYAAAANEWMNGQIDDVKVFNYALTAAQVKDAYNGGAVFFGPATGSP